MGQAGALYDIPLHGCIPPTLRAPLRELQQSLLQGKSCREAGR